MNEVITALQKMLKLAKEDKITGVVLLAQKADEDNVIADVRGKMRLETTLGMMQKVGYIMLKQEIR